MENREKRDARYWMSRFRRDKHRLDKNSKLKFVRTVLIHMASLSPEEADAFLVPKRALSNPEALRIYSEVEKKVSKAYSGEITIKLDRQKFLADMRNSLCGFYSSSELDEIESIISSDANVNVAAADISVITMDLAGDHYGVRRIRNSYLPKIVDIIEIDPQTGASENLTERVFGEGPGDTVSKLERSFRYWNRL